MLRWRCLWGPDFFSCFCWTYLHMNWIRTSPFRPEEHAFLPIALVSDALLPFSISQSEVLFSFFFFSPHHSYGAQLYLCSLTTTGLIFIVYWLIDWFCRYRCKRVWFTEMDAGSVGFCRCPTGNRWARSLVLTPESAGCVMLIGSLRCLCMLQRSLCWLL